MHVVISIEARMSASRLPGKMLFPLGNKPVLAALVERLRIVRNADAIVVATTDHHSDEPIAAWAERLGVHCFRGSEHDVMGRVLGAARSVDAELIVELTGDNPLIDPAIIEKAIELFHETKADYVSNVLERTYPLGMDTQVFPTAVLADAYNRTTDPVDREHVSLFIYRNPAIYRLETFRAAGRFQRPEMRLTLDTAIDHYVISACYDACYAQSKTFGLEEILAFLDANPDVAAANADVKHKWV